MVRKALGRGLGALIPNADALLRREEEKAGQLGRGDEEEGRTTQQESGAVSRCTGLLGF